MRSLIISLFCILSYNCLAQIGGTIIDEETKEPLPFATVYENGTTNGTITNKDGLFKLEKCQYPCDVIVSFVGYSTHSIHMEAKPDHPLTITLRKLSYNLKQVEVKDRNRRLKNEKLFKQHLLGSDQWGKAAKLINIEEVDFKWDYTEKELKLGLRSDRRFLRSLIVKSSNPDSTHIVYLQPRILWATANKPLIIEMPLLGYELHLDLIHFGFDQKLGQCTYLGYWYFKETKTNKLIERRRRQVYYNSSQHFCRSLFDNTLAANGFKIYKMVNKKRQEFPFEKLIHRDEKTAHIIGGQNHIFEIVYFYNGFYNPRDLNEHKMKVPFLQSIVAFNRDTCTVTRQGTIPNSFISFGGVIGGKRVGASLPASYKPEKL